MQQLIALFDYLRDVLWILRRARFTLLVLIVALVAFTFSDQMQDVFRGLKSDLTIRLNSGRGFSAVSTIAAFLGSLVWWAINCWFFTWLVLFKLKLRRRIGDSRTEQQLNASDARILRWARLVPRLIAILPFIVVAIGLLKAEAYIHAAATTAVGAVVVAAIWRILNAASAHLVLKQIELDDGVELPPYTRGFVLVNAFIVVAMFAWTTTEPVDAGSFFGPHNLVFIATASWVAAGSFFVWLGEWLRIPIISLMLIWVFGVSAYNDNHAVRSLGDFEESRPTAQADFANWDQRWKTASISAASTSDLTPLVIIATAGGGARAAYWTATLLSDFQDKIPAFSRHVYAISSVSGGTLGAAVFAGLLATEPALHCALDGHAREFQFGAFRTCATTILGRDFLGPTLAAGLYPDLVQRFLPMPLLPDRAGALERAWEAAWATTMPEQLPLFLSSSFRDATRDGRTPVLLFNGTSVATGVRIITSNIRITAPAEFPNAVDFFSVVPRDIRVSTAVNNTARFPYIGPAGLLCAGECRNDAIVDGGYFENFGAVTARQLIETLYWNVKDLNKHYRLIVVAISSDPDIDAKDDELSRESSCIEPPKPPSIPKLAREVAAPPAALLATRTGRGASALAELHAVTHDHDPACFLHFRLTHRLRDVAPLGWSLSESARRAIDTDIGYCPNKERYAVLRSVMAGGDCPETIE